MKNKKRVVGGLFIFLLLIGFISGYDYEISLNQDKENNLVFSELFFSKKEKIDPADFNLSFSSSLDLESKKFILLSDSRGFYIDKDLIKVKIKQGESKRKVLGFQNNFSESIEVNINSDLEEFVAISENYFVLEPFSFKSINLDFYVKDNEFPDAYLGRIIVRSGNYSKIINLIVDIKERKPLFDVLAKVPDKDFYPGENVNANITVLNMGDLENIDILFHYAIREFTNNTIIDFREESLAINKSLELDRELNLNENLEPGKYVFHAKSSYKDVVATGADVFDVKEREFFSERDVYLIAKIMLIIFFGLVFYFIILKTLSFFRNRKSLGKSKSEKKKNPKKNKKRVFKKNKKNVSKELKKEIGKI